MWCGTKGEAKTALKDHIKDGIYESGKISKVDIHNKWALLSFAQHYATWEA